MTRQLSITLDDELDAQVRAEAGTNISAWLADAARERLNREKWERYRDVTAPALGIDSADWMTNALAAREAARAPR